MCYNKYMVRNFNFIGGNYEYIDRDRLVGLQEVLSERQQGGGH